MTQGDLINKIMGSNDAQSTLVSRTVLTAKIMEWLDATRSGSKNTIYIVAYNEDGKLVRQEHRGSNDVQKDCAVMDAAVEFHYAAMRGVVIKDCQIGNILISTVPIGPPMHLVMKAAEEMDRRAFENWRWQQPVNRERLLQWASKGYNR